MSYLVTGATGFLGRHLLRELQAQGARAVALVRDAASWDDTVADWGLQPVPAVTGEVTEPATWQDDPALAGVQGIFHLAAVVHHSRLHPEAMVRTNIEGTLAMVRLAAKYRCRLIFVSTSGTVGCFRRAGGAADETAPYVEDTVRHWPYYASKIQAEKAARALADDLGVELVILRPPVILGPEDHRGRSTVNVLRVLRRKVPVQFDGNMHFIDVRDAAAAFVRAMRHPAPQPVYHFPGVSCSLIAFFRWVSRLSGVPMPNRPVPARVIWALAVLNQKLGGQVLRVLPDPVSVEMGSHHWPLQSLHAERDLGFVPRSGDETLKDTIAWLQQAHGLTLPAFPVGVRDLEPTRR